MYIFVRYKIIEIDAPTPINKYTGNHGKTESSWQMD